MISGMREIVKSHRPRSLWCRGRNLTFGRVPLIMGILNVTPDSFSDGGKYLEDQKAVAKAMQLVEDGADIIDIGGESTRPGSETVTPEAELERIVPVLEAIIDRVSIPVSVDTRKASVAAKALELGCHLVNDVSACRDPEMIDVLREHDAPVVIMHMKGDPKTMQDNPSYTDVTGEVVDFLAERAEHLSNRGIRKEHIIIDPGIGFGKRFRDNLDLLSNVHKFKELGYPVLVGGSRKRFLGELLAADTNQRLSGSLGVAAHCWKEAVDIIRVHDVKETAQLLKALDAITHPHDYGGSG